MKSKIKLARARSLAQKIIASLMPGCERIAPAGSILRELPTVGDIEIVCIPKLIDDMPAQLSLLSGEPPVKISALDILLNRLVEEKPHFKRGDRNGAILKNFILEYDDSTKYDPDNLFPVDGEDSVTEVSIEIYITTAPQWGYIYALRTGPAEFCQAWVTPQNKNGLLPDGYSFGGGWLRGPNDEKIATPEEADVFDLIGGALDPTDRNRWYDYHERGKAQPVHGGLRLEERRK